MRHAYASLVLLIGVGPVALGQVSAPTPFIQSLQSAMATTGSIQSIRINGTAEWSAGSQHETGTADLEAHSDGSTRIELRLDKASRTEVQTAIGKGRTCNRTDATGTIYPVPGFKCHTAIPWFAPNLIAGMALQNAASFDLLDEGVTTKDGSAHHQISVALASLRPSLPGGDKYLQNSSKVTVLYDPATLMPSELRYSIHPDKDDSRNIPVRVVFSDIRSVSGRMLPFQIEQFVNNTLQLKISVSNVVVD